MALTNHIVPDSPTNNFCTLNPLSTAGSTTTPITISDGNLKTVHSVTGQWQGAKGTISVSSGIWYFEVVILQVPTGITQNYNIGFYNADIHNGLYYGLAGNLTFGANGSAAQLYVNTSYTSYGSLGSNGSIYMFCLDVDSEKFWVGLNGSWFASGNPSTGVNPSASGFGKAHWTTVQSDYTYSGAGSFQHNYGQDPTFAGNKSPTTTYTDANGIGAFYYQPPTGAKSLCTANLPDFTPTVAGDTPQDYFKAVIWTGQTNAGTYNNGNVTVGFRPDLVWIKARDTGYAQLFNDSLRGTGVELRGNESGSQVARSDGFTAFNTTGFSVGTNAAYNDSAKGMVAWCWKAGGNSNTFNINGTGYSTYSALQTANTSLPASSTSGMIVPSGMSINTDAGFSIVSYTGTGANATVPHGLSSAPEFVVIKGINTVYDWVVYHDSVSSMNTKRLLLNEPTEATDQSSGPWNSTSPNSNVVSIGTHLNVNEDTEDFIMYCWHSVEGYSKFGSYTGNGSPDGPFVYCGFRPAFVMVKWISGGGAGMTSGSWRIMDTARNRYNPATLDLLADDTITDTTLGADDLDILSNGFKWRSTGSYHNYNTANYIFMAFAEQPFKYANAR